jgi:hypothetical protein
MHEKLSDTALQERDIHATRKPKNKRSVDQP